MIRTNNIDDMVEQVDTAFSYIEDALGIPPSERHGTPEERARHIIHNIDLWRWRSVDLEPVPGSGWVAVLHCESDWLDFGVSDGRMVATAYTFIDVNDVTHWAPIPDREEIEAMAMTTENGEK